MPGKRVPGHAFSEAACLCGWATAAATKRERRSHYAEHLAGARADHGVQCRDCEQDRTPREMSRSKPSICKQCSTARTRAWAEAHPDEWERHRRKSWLKQKYGITPEEYDAVLASQGGNCAICGEPPSDSRGYKMHVDHNHSTGAVRGILCGPCNRGIGNLGDDIERLRAAIRYLEQH
jgi:hypothetical protein